MKITQGAAQKVVIEGNINNSGDPVSGLPAGEEFLGATGGKTLRATVEIITVTPQAAYIAGDAVLKSGGGLSELQGAARVTGGSGYIVTVRISTNKKSITPRLRVHFFNASNPTLSADNAPWQEKYADASKRVGFVDLPAMTTATDTTNSDMSRAQDYTIRMPFVCNGGSNSLFVGLETLDGFTPDNAQRFTVTIFTEVN